jgi:hypothetical protein
MVAPSPLYSRMNATYGDPFIGYLPHQAATPSQRELVCSQALNQSDSEFDAAIMR